MKRVIGLLRKGADSYDPRPIYQGKQKRPWMPPGWPFGGWFNMVPNRPPPVSPVRLNKPGLKLVPRNKDQHYSIRFHDRVVTEPTDEASLDQLRAMVYDTRGPIYADLRKKPTAEEIEEGFLKRLADEGKLNLTIHEKRDLLLRRRYRASAKKEKWDKVAEKEKLEEPLQNSAETKAFIKEYSSQLEGFGWKDPYTMSDDAVREEWSVLRDQVIETPGAPLHWCHPEWTQRQDLVVEQWQSNRIPCSAGDQVRDERMPTPPWRDAPNYVGQVPDEDDMFGPPGSAYMAHDEDLPPGTQPGTPPPTPKHITKGK